MIVLFATGVSVLGFILGVAVAEFELFPHSYLRDGFTAAKAYYLRFLTNESRSGATGNPDVGLWRKASTSKTGVVQLENSETSPGFTLYSSADFQGANLVDMRGNIVHRWRKSFRAVWPDPPHVARPVPRSQIYWRDVHLFPDGKILALYAGMGDTPFGYGLAKMDAHSEVLWTYDKNTHHDVHVADDGSIYVLTQQFRDLKERPIEALSELEGTIIEDFVVELSSEGRERNRFSIPEALSESKVAKWISSPTSAGRWDPFHTNNVEPVTRDFAEHHRGVQPGDILVSLRHPDVIAILEPDRGTPRIVLRGDWISQHDPDSLPNGNILFFDNLGSPDASTSGASRIVELSFSPYSQNFDWWFVGTPSRPFESQIRSVQQKLPNGNVLITESNGGRMMEVTEQKQLVWEFYNPTLEEVGKDVFRPVISAGTRIPAKSIEFELDH